MGQLVDDTQRELYVERVASRVAYPWLCMPVVRSWEAMTPAGMVVPSKVMYSGAVGAAARQVKHVPSIVLVAAQGQLPPATGEARNVLISNAR